MVTRFIGWRALRKKGHDHMFCCRFVDINFIYSKADIEKRGTNNDCCKLSQGSETCVVRGRKLKGAVSRNSAKLGNYKMPVKLRET